MTRITSVATASHDDVSSAGRLDRRQLLKAGAWAAPVIVLAAAVPAASASDPNGRTLHFNSFGSYFTDDGAGHRNGVILNGQISVAYDNTGPGYTGYPVGNVTMMVYLPKDWFATGSTVTLYAGSSSRWTQSGGGVVVGNSVRFTFISVANVNTIDPLTTGNLTVGFSSIGILPSGTTITVAGTASAPQARTLSGERELTVP